jgi:hypothetical protein
VTSSAGPHGATRRPPQSAELRCPYTWGRNAGAAEGLQFCHPERWEAGSRRGGRFRSWCVNADGAYVEGGAERGWRAVHTGLRRWEPVMRGSLLQPLRGRDALVPAIDSSRDDRADGLVLSRSTEPRSKLSGSPVPRRADRRRADANPWYLGSSWRHRHLADEGHRIPGGEPHTSRRARRRATAAKWRFRRVAVADCRV